VKLTDEEVATVKKAHKEGGGFQELFADMEHNLNGNELSVDKELGERIIRYCKSYGPGGWQDKLRPIAAKIEAAISQ